MKFVVRYISEEDVAEDEIDLVGWWWRRGNDPSVGPFQTRNDADDDAKYGCNSDDS